MTTQHAMQSFTGSPFSEADREARDARQKRVMEIMRRRSCPTLAQAWQLWERER